MRDLLRGMLGLDAIVPIVLIIAAVLMTLDPTIFGVAVSERQIVLGFFGFLGIDALVERTGRLSRIERRLDVLADKTSGQPAASELLRPRSSFERMDALARQARRSVLIIGVNLELLRTELGTRLDAGTRGRVSLMVTDLVLPVGVVGLDEHTHSGSLIIQHYLTGTASEHAPLM